MRVWLSMFSLLLTACAATVTGPPALPSALDVDCEHELKAETLVGPPVALSTPSFYGKRITALRIRGSRAVPDRILRKAVQLRVGQTLERARLKDDFRRLLRFEVFANVGLEATPHRSGVALTFRLVERSVIGEITVGGVVVENAGVDTLRTLSGNLYEPVRLLRTATRLEHAYHANGHLDAKVRVSRGRAANGRIDVCFVLDPGQRFTIERWSFSGNNRMPERKLRALVNTRGGRVNKRGKPYRADALAEMYSAVRAEYFNRGMIMVRLSDPQITRFDNRGRLRIVIPIEEGEVYRFGTFDFTGAPEDVRSAKKLVSKLPGRVFSRTAIQELKQEIGYRGVMTTINSDKRLVDVIFDLQKGQTSDT